MLTPHISVVDRYRLSTSFMMVPQSGHGLDMGTVGQSIATYAHVIPRSSTIPLASSSSEGEGFFEDWMARGGTGQAKKGAAVVGFFSWTVWVGPGRLGKSGSQAPRLGGT